MTVEVKETRNDLATEFASLPREIQKLDGAVIYEGWSPVMKQKIAVIISGIKGTSQNRKTGAMAQIDILLAGMHPIEAIKTGMDEAICGSCPLRGNVCYVRVGHGPSSKWRKYNRNGYEKISPTVAGLLLKHHGTPSRLGAYADPAMVPYEVWQELLTTSGTNHTSYTHQWMEPWFDPRHLEISMASIDHENTVEKLRELHGNTPRYYRLVDDYENLQADEIKCPSDKDKIQCANCGLCSGQKLQAKNIVIIEE